MSEEYGPEFITVTDEDGNDIELELVDVLEHKGITYMAFFPAVLEDVDEESDDYGLVILKSVQEDGEELLLAWLDQLERISPNEEDQNTLRYLREECGDRDWPQVEARTRALLEGPYHGA